jgi:hypothetical protein
MKKTAFIGAILIIFLSSIAHAQWPTESPNGSYPQGLMGHHWFNYNNDFVRDIYQFSRWDPVRQTDSVNWCIYGAIASIMLYHEWPAESWFSGFNSSNELEYIWGHEWDYKAIKSVDWHTDPATVDLQYNPGSAADEITRLYVAAHRASQAGSSYGNLLYYENEPWYGKYYYNHHRIRWTFINKLGFPDCHSIYVPWASHDWGDTVHYQVNVLKNPVIGVEAGHAYVIDGVKKEGRIYKFHVCDFYTSKWQTKDDLVQGGLKTLILPGSPRVKVQTLRNFVFCFGDFYLNQTGGTDRWGLLQIQNVSQTTQPYKVTIRSNSGAVVAQSTFSGGWVNYLGWLDFNVPASTDSNKFARNYFYVTVENLGDSPQEYRMVWDDLSWNGWK